MELYNMPILISGCRAEHLMTEETAILDLAATLIRSGDDSLRVHVDAITLANGLADLHADDTPENEAPALAAEQLKLHHLDLLDRYFELVSPQF